MKKQFKTIGIVGGAGPMASCYLYRSVIQHCQRVFGCKDDGDFPKIWQVSYPFDDMVLSDQACNNKMRIAGQLCACLSDLRRLGAQSIGIACNTLHSFLPLCDGSLGDCVLLPECVQMECMRLDLQRVLVLGTETTFQSGLYDAVPGCVYPDVCDQKKITAIINRILAGYVLAQDAVQLRSLVDGVRQKNVIDAVVLGCTELGVLYQDMPGIMDAGDWVVIDTIAVLARALVQIKQ